MEPCGEKVKKIADDLNVRLPLTTYVCGSGLSLPGCIRRERPSTPSAHMALTRPVVPPDGSFIWGPALHDGLAERGRWLRHCVAIATGRQARLPQQFAVDRSTARCSKAFRIATMQVDDLTMVGGEKLRSRADFFHRPFSIKNLVRLYLPFPQNNCVTSS
jgi:hypothetical protein